MGHCSDGFGGISGFHGGLAVVFGPAIASAASSPLPISALMLWGMAKGATGGFELGLLGSSAMVLIVAGLTLMLRTKLHGAPATAGLLATGNPIPPWNG